MTRRDRTELAAMLGVPESELGDDVQAYEHDRAIPDAVRVAVLERDGFKCVECGRSRAMLSPDDPRNMLELHHGVTSENGI